VISQVVPANYDAALRRANALFDRMVQALDMPVYAERNAEFVACEGEIQAMDKRGVIGKLGHLEERFLITFLPSLTRIQVLMTNSLAERDLALTALVLRSARASGGSYPESLVDLKAYTVPMDQFTGGPLVYRKKGAGYVLYSLGENQKDDGGVREKNSRTGDLVVEATQ